MWKTILSMILGSAIALYAGSAMATQRADVAWQQVQAGALLVDVRTPAEFAQGHLDNAINIPLDTVPAGFADIAQDRSIVVYCRSGNRSGIAMQALIDQGFINVHNGGGLSEMQQAELNQPPLN